MQVDTTMNSVTRTMRLAIAALIVISTILFVAGVIVERGRHSGEVQGTTQEANKVGQAATPLVAGEAGEGQGHVEGSSESSKPTTTTTTTTTTTSSETNHTAEGNEAHTETVLGVDLENPWVVAAFVVGWLALIIAIFAFGWRGLLAVTVAAIVALIFDIGEASMQFGMGDSLVGIIAALVAAAHSAIAVLSLWLFTRGYQQTDRQSI